MKSKKTVFEKQIIRKKMISLIIYGIIFLISTIAFYFVNSSKAKNVLKVGVSIIDEEANIEVCNYELKVQEEDGNYKTELLPIQNGFKVKKYKLASKKEFEEYKKIYEEKTVVKDKKDKEDNKTDLKIQEDINNEEKNKEDNKEASKEENNEYSNNENKTENKDSKNNEKIEENLENSKKENQEKEQVDKSKEKSENEKEEKKDTQINQEENIHKSIGDETESIVESALNSKEIKLTDEQIEEKQIYIIAEYDYKEAKKEVLYNKIISASIEKTSVNISGYMPRNAEVKLKNQDIEETKEKILNNFQDVNKEINLVAAYDIKILSEEKEFEPEEFDENAIVTIKGIDGQNFKIWHIKNDNTVELIEPKKDSENIEFETEGFSIYAIELVAESEKKEKNETENQIKEEIIVDSVDNNTLIDENITNESNSIEENNTIADNTITTGTKSKTTVKRTPRKAAARNSQDSTLEIDDYQSDYYYYMGKNYTDNISGTNTNTYSSSNLVKVTLYYHGFAQGETDNEKKGWISLDSNEGHDIIKNIKCVPVKNGSVTIELMENPFMDKPTGYGFGGWTASTGTINKDAKTLTYSLNVSTTSDITVNLYAKWEAATVVYVNPATGSDNHNDGLSEGTPFGSWEKAFEYVNSHNKNDREKNIIVLTGNIDSSINYTRPVTTTITKPVKNINYTSSTTFTTGSNYLLATGQGVGANAITASGTGITNTRLTDSSAPPNDAEWTFSRGIIGYYIQNASTGQYLSYSTSGGLTLSSNGTEWRVNDRKLYCRIYRISFFH